jgi:excisionase family DNA binding protein
MYLIQPTQANTLLLQALKIAEGGRHMETNALLSVEEAAKRLGGISKWTVHQWLSQGKLRRTKVGGRTMIRESELARVIRDEGAPPEPPAKAVTQDDGQSGEARKSLLRPDINGRKKQESSIEECQ